MTRDRPRVSVILPFLNASAFMAEAIDSVEAQSFPDWELILVDDGSTDGSDEIAAARASSPHGRIRVLPPDDSRRGAAAARNRGIAESSGDFVAFLDADDLFAPDKLEHEVAALDADPAADWVYGATRWFHADGSRADRIERLGTPRDRRYDPPELLIRILLGERGDVPCTCGVMIRREPLEALGGFEESLSLYEDQALWAKLMLTRRVRVLSGCRAAYRQHAGSTSALATASGSYNQKGPHSARRVFLEWLEAHVAGGGGDPRVLGAIQTAIRLNERGPLNTIRRRIRRLSRYLP